MKAWTLKMDDPNLVDTVSAKLSAWNAERRRVMDELAAAQREAASPVAEAWGEFRTLAAMAPAQDTDELRVRIKAAFRRVVESIYCIFVGIGRTRLAEAQIHFRGGAFRSYTIIYDPGRSNHRVSRPGRRWIISFRHPEDANAGLPFNTEDLRDATMAEMVESYLRKFTPEDVERLLALSDRPWHDLLLRA